MTHLELEDLASDYLEGRLDAVRRAEAEAHLRDCGACRELLGDLRRAVALCQAAEELEPSPWLIPKIFRATVGERKPTWGERVRAFFRPSPQPRLAYAVAMAIFSLSVIINAAGVDLRNLTVADLHPRSWFYQANRTGHRLYARAEKFYYDLRVVYEIESRFRQLQPKPSEPAEEAPRQESTPGGSTELEAPGRTAIASTGRLPAIPLLRLAPQGAHPTRSTSP